MKKGSLKVKLQNFKAFSSSGSRHEVPHLFLGTSKEIEEKLSRKSTPG